MSLGLAVALRGLPRLLDASGGLHRGALALVRALPRAATWGHLLLPQDGPHALRGRRHAAEGAALRTPVNNFE